MSTIVTRSGKGSPLSHLEVDTNFTNLNTDKVEKTAADITGGTINNTVIGGTTRVAGSFTDLTTTNAPTFGVALPIASGGTEATTAGGAISNLYGYTTTATATGTTTLTNTSTLYQIFTGTLGQTVRLPLTSTLQLGWQIKIAAATTAGITIQTNNGTGLTNGLNGTEITFTCLSVAGTNLANEWRVGYTGVTSATGNGALVLGAGPTFNGVTIGGSINANTNTASILLGSAQTTGILTIGGASGTGILTVGQSTVSQTTNIQAGATASGSTKTVNFGTGGIAGSTTNIAIGSTTGTSTTTFNGITKNQTYLVANLPSASTSGVGASAFVTNALTPTFGATVVTGGAVAVPVYSDGTNWKVG